MVSMKECSKLNDAVDIQPDVYGGDENGCSEKWGNARLRHTVGPIRALNWFRSTIGEKGSSFGYMILSSPGSIAVSPHVLAQDSSPPPPFPPFHPLSACRYSCAGHNHDFQGYRQVTDVRHQATRAAAFDGERFGGHLALGYAIQI